MPSDTRVRKEAISLAQSGILVTIIVNALSSVDPIHKNIKMIGLNYDPTTKGGGSPMSIVRLTRYWIFCVKSYLSLTKGDFLVIHCHDSTTLIPGIILKLLRPYSKLVYDSHESAIDSISENFGFLLTFITYCIEILSFVFISTIITVSPLQKQVLQFRYRRILPNVVLVRNLPLREELIQHPIEKGQELMVKYKIDRSKLLIVYATYLGVHRGIPELMNAWSKLKRDDIVLILAGDGPLKEVTLKLGANLSNFHFIGYLQASLYYSLMRNCDLGLSLIDPGSNLNKKIGYPNKITEYLASGLTPLSTRLENFKKEFQEGKAIAIESLTEIAILETLTNLDVDNLLEKRKYFTDTINKEYLWENDLTNLISIYGR